MPGSSSNYSVSPILRQREANRSQARPAKKSKSSKKIELKSNVRIRVERRGRPRVYDDDGNRIDGKPGHRTYQYAYKTEVGQIQKQQYEAREKLRRQAVSQSRIKEVDQCELELPYRGLFGMQGGNTFLTQPDNATRALFQQLLSVAAQERKMNNAKYLADSDQRPSGLKYVHFGDFLIETWFKSPYPPKMAADHVLHVCQYCFRYFGSAFSLSRHQMKCPCFRSPPGNEIYREGEFSVFEVDGRKNTVYCQNLCLFAKLFLNSKTLYYDVEPFMFYILCKYTGGTNSHQFLGYFSKEKLNSTGYNLSCIMTLPLYQRKGYGSFLMDFSYLLSRREFKLGTPEKPLSDLGLLSYRSYWKYAVARALRSIFDEPGVRKDDFCNISINDVCNLTGMIPNDVIVGLEQLEALVLDQATQKYGILLDMERVNSVLSAWSSKQTIKVNDDLLIWKPPILGPSGGINTTSKMVITAGSPQDKKLEPEKQDAKTVTAATSLNGQKFDEKGNPLMSDISLIVNFLKDDLEDDRPLEEQAFQSIREQNMQHKDSGLKFDECKICYPGMGNGRKIIGGEVTGSSGSGKRSKMGAINDKVSAGGAKYGKGGKLNPIRILNGKEREGEEGERGEGNEGNGRDEGDEENEENGQNEENGPNEESEQDIEIIDDDASDEDYSDTDSNSANEEDYDNDDYAEDIPDDLNDAY